MNHEIKFVTRNIGNDEVGNVEISGYTHEDACGIFDSYISALADAMGLWEEYCEYHRLRKIK